MVRGSKKSIRERGGRRTNPGAPVNLSRQYAGRQPALVAHRRGAWFVCSLAGCGILAGIGAIALVTTQSGNNATATVRADVALRPLSTALPDRIVTPGQGPADLGAPLITGSLGTASRAAAPTSLNCHRKGAIAAAP